MDYLTASCAESTLKLFQPYNKNVCDFINGTIVGVFVTVPGTTITCIQDQTEVTAAITANTAQFIPALGTLNDATANTVDVPFPYGPTEIVEDYTKTIDYEAPYIDGNYDFWNEIVTTGGSLGEAYWVVKGGLIVKMEGTITMTANWGFNDPFLTVKGTFTYKSNTLDKPYYALGPVFGANSTIN